MSKIRKRTRVQMRERGRRDLTYIKKKEKERLERGLGWQEREVVKKL